MDENGRWSVRQVEMRTRRLPANRPARMLAERGTLTKPAGEPAEAAR
jgi:hypothetical protein